MVENFKPIGNICDIILKSISPRFRNTGLKSKYGGLILEKEFEFEQCGCYYQIKCSKTLKTGKIKYRPKGHNVVDHIIWDDENVKTKEK
jgi:hypothetical protein